MDMTRKVEFFIFLAATVLAGFIYLNDQHASRQALVHTEFELRAELLEGQAKSYAETANHYRNIEKSRDLEPGEETRKEYAARQAIVKQKKADRVQDTLSRIEAE